MKKKNRIPHIFVPVFYEDKEILLLMLIDVIVWLPFPFEFFLLFFEVTSAKCKGDLMTN